MIQSGPFRIHALTTWTTIFLLLLGMYIYFPLSWVDFSLLVWRGRIFRILSYGDSLTEGLYSWPESPRFHPYTHKLEHLLNENSQRTNGSVFFLIRNEGKSGDRASRKMFSRLKSLLRRSRSKFDLAIILAGTNDLIDIIKGNKENYTTESITNHIKYMHELCHQNDIVTVAMTIPETGVEGSLLYNNLTIMRKEINENLKEYSDQNPERVLLFDLAAALPRRGATADSDPHLWDDGLHLTRAGYDRMAEAIYRGLKSKINEILP